LIRVETQLRQTQPSAVKDDQKNVVFTDTYLGLRVNGTDQARSALMDRSLKGWTSLMEHGVNDIDALVREEKRLTAVESHSEAWAEGLSAGIEPEIIAEAALETAFGEMLRANGETSALALLDRMREKVIAGAFEPERLRH